MIRELYGLVVIGAIAICGVYDYIRYREFKGSSSDDVIRQFDSFTKRCKNKKTARVLFFLPTLKGASLTTFLYGVKVYGNEELIEEALRTNDFRKIIKREHVDFDYMKQGKYKFESVPLSNWFKINYYND